MMCAGRYATVESPDARAHGVNLPGRQYLWHLYIYLVSFLPPKEKMTL